MTAPRNPADRPATEPRPTEMSDGHWNHDVEKSGDNRYCHTCQRWVGR